MTNLETKAKAIVDKHPDLSREYLLSVMNQFFNGQKNHDYDQYQLAFYQMREVIYNSEK